MNSGIQKVAIYIVLSMSLIMPVALCAKDLGTFGTVYPIVEADFLAFIESRVRDLQQQALWTSIQNNIRALAIYYRDRPTPVAGIQAATLSKSWLIDPAITLDHDVISAEGVVIAKQGTRINPLYLHALSKTLIFYDGDDPKMVRWVLKMDQALHGQDKLILTKGSVLDQEKQFKKIIYFDQQGILSTRFHIQRVPAFVKQEGASLRVTEVPV